MKQKCSKTRKNNTNRGLVKGGQMGSTNPLKSIKQHGSDQPTEPRVGCVRANGQGCGSYDWSRFESGPCVDPPWVEAT